MAKVTDAEKFDKGLHKFQDLLQHVYILFLEHFQETYFNKSGAGAGCQTGFKIVKEDKFLFPGQLPQFGQQTEIFLGSGGGEHRNAI